MVVITTVACLVALQAPQLPGGDEVAPPRESRAAVAFATALPAKTLAAFSWRVQDHLDELRRTQLYQILNRLPVPDEALLQLVDLEAKVTAATGLDRRELLAALSREATIAWTGLDNNGNPEGVLIATLGDDAESFRQAMATLTAETSTTTPLLSATTIADTPVWTLTTPGPIQPVLTVHEGRLLAATTSQALDDVLTLQGDGNTSLADSQFYTDLSSQIDDADTTVLSGVIKPSAVLAASLPHLDTAELAMVRSFVQALGFDRVTGIGYSLRAENGELHDQLRLEFPEPRNGIIAALLGSGTKITSTATDLVPAGVSAFGVTHISLHDIYIEATSILKSGHPNAWAMMQATTERMHEAVGVHLEHDLLGVFGERIVSLHWTKPSGEQDMAIVVDATDTWRLGRAVNRLLTQVVGPLKPRTWRDHKIYAVPFGDGDEGMALTYAVSDSHIIFGNSEDAVRNALTQIDSPHLNPDAKNLLAELPDGATWASWSDLGQTSRALLQVAERSATRNSLGGMDDLREVVGELDGTIRSHMVLDDRGATLRSSSPVGNMYGIAAVSVVGAVAIPNLLSTGAAAEIAAVSPDQDLRRTLGRIAAAEHAHHASTGRYADLDELILKGAARADELGAAIGDGVFEHGEFLLKVMIPDDAEAQTRSFAAMAWPNARRVGSVMAATPRHPLLRNDAIAASMGISMVEATDLYLSGRFGTALVPGWQTIAVEAHQVSTPESDRKQLEAILAAEAAGSAEVADDVVRSLESPNGLVAARAAYALGRLGATAAVPQLCAAVVNHPDREVRRQAMAALRRLRDPAAKDAAIIALGAEDDLLRALAAATLGQLRSPNAAQHLLAVLASEPSTDTDADGTARVAALVALADLDARDQLLPAASAITQNDAQLGQGLTFLFQTLAPKLERSEEIRVLSAVLDHPSRDLRRWSIQRLGELGDRTAAPALRERLTAEGAELKPLVEAALRAVGSGAGSGRPTMNATVDRIIAGWTNMTTEQKAMVAGGGAGTLILFGGFMFWLRRRRHGSGHAGDYAAAAAASDYADEGYDEGYDEAYDDDVDFDEHDLQAEPADNNAYDQGEEYADQDAFAADEGDAYDDGTDYAADDGTYATEPFETDDAADPFLDGDGPTDEAELVGVDQELAGWESEDTEDGYEPPRD